MSWVVSWRWGAAAAGAFALSLWLGAREEARLVVAPVDGMVTFAQGTDGVDESAPSNGESQRIRETPSSYTAVYRYKNFNGDQLTVEYALGKEAWRKYDASYGYYKKDIKAIDDWLNTARQGAYKYAVASHKSQEQLNAALAGLDKERDRKVLEYLHDQGFKKLPGNLVAVDVPAIVKRNAPVLNRVAGAIDSVAVQQKYDTSQIVGAATSLVQTALIYKVPPDVEADGRHTGGLLPPATSMVRGWGDCDTKSTLLASIMANWTQMKMVGIAVPDHYLMGVLQIPNKGDAFVEHEGLQYVLIEAAGPAWLQPGQVSDHTTALLQASEGYRVEPFF